MDSLLAGVPAPALRVVYFDGPREGPPPRSPGCGTDTWPRAT